MFVQAYREEVAGRAIACNPPSEDRLESSVSQKKEPAVEARFDFVRAAATKPPSGVAASSSIQKSTVNAVSGAIAPPFEMVKTLTFPSKLYASNAPSAAGALAITNWLYKLRR